MELVEAIFYKKINPGDLLNIDHALHQHGGGQTYLDLAGIPEEDLCRFLEYGAVIAREHPPEGDTRSKYGINAIAIGTDESQLLEFDPRNNRPNYKLSDQRAHRHPAWTQRFGFPVSPAGARYARDVNNIPNLLVYIIRTSYRNYYAGFLNSPALPNEWPVGIGLECFVTGERKGVFFLENTIVEFQNSAVSPFSILTAEPIVDIAALPEDIANQTADALEFADQDIDIPVGIDFTYEERAAPRRIVRAGRHTQRAERHGRHVDYVRAQRNRTAIGNAGERAVVEYERKRLIDLGRADLAESVEWVSDTQGDGLGYDIHSFDVVDGEVVDRHIEVKTTTGAIGKPFDVSANEVEFSAENPTTFVLFRIFEFSPHSNNIHFYQVIGSLAEHFDLHPTSHLAYPV